MWLLARGGAMPGGQSFPEGAGPLVAAELARNAQGLGAMAKPQTLRTVLEDTRGLIWH